nr:zinc finger protein 23 [Leptinotarsa decemlineata]
MDSVNICCPVCTLFLRPGITLKQHLTSHPKQKVIDALVKLSLVEESPTAKSSASPQLLQSPNVATVGSSHINTAVVNHSWNQTPPVPLGNPPQVSPSHGNHLFIYQQSMSTTSPQPPVMHVNPLSQQYVYPTAFNPLMMMPYVYQQQQQVILSSNSSLPPQIKALSFDSHNSLESQKDAVSVIDTNESQKECRIVEVEDNIEKPSEEIVDDPKIEESLFNESITIIEKHERSLTDDNVETMEDFENERMLLNDIPPDDFQPERDDDNTHQTDHSTGQVDQNNHLVGQEVSRSPISETNSEWKSETELSKACQTQNAGNASPTSQVVEEELVQENDNNFIQEDQPEYFYMDSQNDEYVEQEPNEYVSQQSTEQTPFTEVETTENYEQSEPIYTSANILHGDHLDFVNLDDIIIINEFPPNQIVAQVENFESTSPERPRVLMTIGEIPDHSRIDYVEHRDFEESMSRGSSQVNIRSDERMPARGELSGQESIGGNSDITWNQLQYQEGSSRMSQSYDLIGRGSWEASDSDSVDMPTAPQNSTQVSYQPNEYEVENDTPTIVSCTGPPLNFKCSTCGRDFATSKERKEHEVVEHFEKSKPNLVGTEVGKKRVKKLVLKLKPENAEVEHNFDNVFTNKLKQESNAEPQAEKSQLETTFKIDEPALEPLDLKTICPICDQVCPNARTLKAHKIEAHKENAALKHKCSTCSELFPNEYKYTEHLKIHPLECKLCGKLFYRRQNIRLHMKRHLGLKPFKCEICDKCFITRQKYNEHKNIHTGEAPIKCNLCDEKFRRHSNLVQHRNRHHFQLKKKVKDYICQCGEIFHSKKKLAWHKEIHDAKPKACTQCSEKFLHMSSLTRHMRRAHNDKFLPEDKRQSENVQCPICNGTYLRSSLDVHIKSHSGERPFSCLMCNKVFTTKWNLKLHKWTHASRTSKPFKCDQCVGAFIRETDYIAHMNSHKSVRPYTCNYCGAQFIRKYNCLRHVKEHENAKTFSCTVCSKSFHRSYYLKDHMKVHSGIRPHHCGVCGKTSTTKSNHNKHLQIHHAREPVSTEN